MGGKREKLKRLTFEMVGKTAIFPPVSLACLRNLYDTATHHYLVPHFFHARKTTRTAETNNTECRASLQHRRQEMFRAGQTVSVSIPNAQPPRPQVPQKKLSNITIVY